MPDRLFEAARSFANRDLQALADSVDTGPDRSETSRALLIFNFSSSPLTGGVCFHVDMPWRERRALPPLHILNLLTGRDCGHEIRGQCYTAPFAEGEKGRLAFELWFEAQDVPAEGWDTYIASYVESSQPSVVNRERVQEGSYAVVETLRHAGKLPPRGTVGVY